MGMSKTTLARVIGASNSVNIPAAVAALLQSKGGSLLLPGPNGTLRHGFQPGNYEDSAGTIFASTNGVIGRVNDAGFGGFNASQATTQNKPYLRVSSGVQSWQFDGTEDRLALNAVPFQVNDDYWIVSGATCTRATGDASILSLRGSASPTPIAGQIGLNAGRVDAVWRNDAGVLLRVTDTVSLLNSPVIASVTKAGNVKNLYRDNVLVGTNTDAVGSTTVNTATVGAAVTTTVQNQFGGDIHAIMFGTGTLTGSQLLLLRTFVAQLQERTL